MKNKINTSLSINPESGMGVLAPSSCFEGYFNRFIALLPVFSAIFLALIALLITWDVVGRVFFNTPLDGVTDIEGLCMCIIGFASLTYSITSRSSLQIDLLFEYFTPHYKRILVLFAYTICCIFSFTLGYNAIMVSTHWVKETGILDIIEWPFILFTGICFVLAGMAFLFQITHILRVMILNKEYAYIFVAILLAILLISLPFIYRMSGIRMSGLAIGGVGFLILLILMLIRVPLGFAMSIIGLLGLFALVRRPEAALETIGSIPFAASSDFLLIAFPMFMLMGEMVFLSGLSNDLFNAAEKWLGRLPGGLAVATVGGCAGFGAVCGDSMACVITMSSVALPPMRANNYKPSLAAGVLAAGGTLGILIPPSMGFIIYSMITEESTGKLFVAGILPGLLLASIFISITIFIAVRHPDWAPKAQKYTLKEKLYSLLFLIPIIILFIIVVMGILYGVFTPAEGGAVGAVLSFLYALARRSLTKKIFFHSLYNSAAMFGKIFVLFVGLEIFGYFLATSRLPNLLADFVMNMEMNKYIVLTAVIIIYIVLGCVMNIMPMMMLTLPSIYPTIQALGFDGIWFGVLCVVVMEMGMITPPVGMNVFTMASLAPDIPMSSIFKGVLPYFLGMILCVALLIIFPQIALFLVPN